MKLLFNSVILKEEQNLYYFNSSKIYTNHTLFSSEISNKAEFLLKLPNKAELISVKHLFSILMYNAMLLSFQISNKI